MQVDRICAYCKKPFVARSADVNRGWARFCSKSCKAMVQEARTGQYASLLTAEHLSDHDDQSWGEHEIWSDNHA